MVEAVELVEFKPKTKKCILVTKMECLVKDMKIKSMEEINLFFLPIN